MNRLPSPIAMGEGSGVRVLRRAGRPSATLPPMSESGSPPPAGSGSARRIVHADAPVRPSPSGLPAQHLVSGRDGATAMFLGQQWLQPGERVYLHTHPVEEALTFLAGVGEATVGDGRFPIGPGVSLYIPPGVVHGFRCLAGTLHVLIQFPTPEFAETTMVEDGVGESGSRGVGK